MSERILILSDTHLGRKRCAARSAEALRPLWQDVDRVIVNGDVGEVHHPLHRGAAGREILRLQDLCDDDGVRLTLLSGNHDPYLSDQRHLELADGEVFVTHGDALHPAIAPWSPAARVMRDAHDYAMSVLLDESHDRLAARLAASQHASHLEWLEIEKQAMKSSVCGMVLRPWLFASVLRYWRLFPALAAGFLDDHAPRARFMVLGHTHHPAIDHVRDRIIVNTGSFGFPGRPRAVLLLKTRLEVFRIRSREGCYRLAPRPLAGFELAGGTAATCPGSVRPSVASM